MGELYLEVLPGYFSANTPFKSRHTQCSLEVVGASFFPTGRNGMDIFDAPMVGSNQHMREILNQMEYQANYKLLLIFKHAEKNWLKCIQCTGLFLFPNHTQPCYMSYSRTLNSPIACR